MNQNLYPELGESGKNQARSLLDKFKLEMLKVIEQVSEETLGDLYCDVANTIESDSWTNYRNAMVLGFCEYDSNGGYDYKRLRSKILDEHRESIIKDLNQDNIEEIKKLEIQIEWYRSALGN